MRDHRWYLRRSIIFNGHGHEEKGFCLQGTGKTYVSLDKIKEKIILWHKMFSNDSLKQTTQLYFIQCWGHKHDHRLDNCNVKVFSYTTDEQPLTYNLKGGHSAMITLAEQYVADINDAVNSALDDTVAEAIETD